MPRFVRLTFTVLVPLLVAALVGCDAAKPSTPATSPGATAGTTASVGPAASRLDGGLPDLGLTNVTTDRQAARSALIGPAGGSVSVMDAHGAAYTLTVPADALSESTQIGLYPVSSLATLPAGSSLVAGVQLTPDGLQLRAPAHLSITLASTIDTAKAVAIRWRGDGQRDQVYPAIVDGQTLTMSILHFSGAGVSPAELALALGCEGVTDVEECEADAFLPTLAADARSSDPRTSLLTDLRFMYRAIVVPAFGAGDAYALGLVDGGSPTREDETAYPYLVWLDAIGFAQQTLNDPSFTVAPELARSRDVAAGFLRGWFSSENNQCVAVKDDVNVRNPLFWAETAMAEASGYAGPWGIAMPAKRLDQQTLLDSLCVKVAIDPSRSYSASIPGEAGTISIKAGFTIAGGPLRTAPNPIRVTVSTPGSTTPLGDRDTDADGTFEIPNFTWPVGADPLEIDIHATLTEFHGDSEVLTQIARFDRISKHPTRLSFTFDKGFDGWLSDTAGPVGSSNWGQVDHLSIGGNGVMHMDGRGVPTRPNSWIYRSFQLPSSTTTLSFDASAEIIAGSSSSVMVRIVSNGVSTPPILTATLRNSRNGLSFTRETVDISKWAGQHVTIYIEQNDNTPGGSIGFDKEIYIDNVRITTV